MPGQNLQHFIRNSPWPGLELIQAIQNEIKAHPAFQEAVPVLDESAKEKAGERSAGGGGMDGCRVDAGDIQGFIDGHARQDAGHRSGQEGRSLFHCG